MLNLDDFSYGRKDMESCLNEYGLTAGIWSKYADNGLKNIRFFVIMGLMSDEEAQMMLNRIIAKVGANISEI